MNRSDRDFKQDRPELLVLDQKLMEQKEYWIERLSHQPEPVNLFLDHPRTSKCTSRTRRQEIRLKGAGFTKLVELTGDSHFLIYTTLMAALKICLYKYSGNNIVTIGSPARKSPGSLRQAPNALAIVNEIDERKSFKHFLADVRQTLLDAYA